MIVDLMPSPATVATALQMPAVQFARPTRRNPFEPWGRMQIWGPVLRSSRCCACRNGITHLHGFYAPTGGE